MVKTRRRKTVKNRTMKKQIKNRQLRKRRTKKRGGTAGLTVTGKEILMSSRNSKKNIINNSDNKDHVLINKLLHTSSRTIPELNKYYYRMTNPKKVKDKPFYRTAANTFLYILFILEFHHIGLKQPNEIKSFNIENEYKLDEEKDIEKISENYIKKVKTQREIPENVKDEDVEEYLFVNNKKQIVECFNEYKEDYSGFIIFFIALLLQFDNLTTNPIISNPSNSNSIRLKYLLIFFMIMIQFTDFEDNLPNRESESEKSQNRIYFENIENNLKKKDNRKFLLDLGRYYDYVLQNDKDLQKDKGPKEKFDTFKSCFITALKRIKFRNLNTKFIYLNKSHNISQQHDITIINDYYNELFDFLKRFILLSKNSFEEYKTRPKSRTLSL